MGVEETVVYSENEGSVSNSILPRYVNINNICYWDIFSKNIIECAIAK